MKRFVVVVLGQLLAACSAQNLLAQTATVPTRSIPIPPDQLGAVAGKQYSGDGLAVVSKPDGAQLRCAFQRLNAQATAEGLWLVSTADGARGQPFRVVARTIGRVQQEALPRSGKVEASGQMGQFIRPGLVEEYSVSVDGVRQDFVIEQRPEGAGPVRLELEVDGAKAGAMANGALLELSDSGRKLAYHRLKAVDARGKELEARVEVISSNRLAVVLDDAAAEYPVRDRPDLQRRQLDRFRRRDGCEWNRIRRGC
jgi:hypothetical protein